MNEVPLEQLIDDWIDATDSGDGEYLIGALAKSADARRQFVDTAMLHVALYQVCAPGIMPAGQHRPRFRWRPWTLPLIALPIVLGGLKWWLSNDPPPGAEAVSTPVLVDGHSRRSVHGDETFTVPLGPPAEMRLPDGSIVRAAGGSALNIKWLPDELGIAVSLTAGAAQFHLKPGCRFVEVRTPIGRVVALGPEFGMSVQADGTAMDVQAVSGLRVECNGEETILKPGQQQRFSRRVAQ